MSSDALEPLDSRRMSRAMRLAPVALVVLLAGLRVAAAEAAAVPGWRLAHLGIPASTGLVAASCVSADDCAVIAPERIEYWNGNSWSGRSITLGGVAISCVPQSCQTVGPLPIVGAERISRRSVRRERIPTPPDAKLYGARLESVACSSATACVAVGFARADTMVDCPRSTHVYNLCVTDSPLIERWNGRRWSIQHPPLPTMMTPDQPVNSLGPAAVLNGVSCASASACVAVGVWAQQPNSPAQAFAERWNGERWMLLAPAQSVSAVLSGVSCTSADACTAVGWTTPSGPQSLFEPGRGDNPLVEQWNGRGWRVQNAPNPSPSHSTWLDSVSCLGSSCVAVGAAGPQPLIEHRGAGGHWAAQQTPLPPHNHARGGSSLLSVSCGSPESCVAGGAYGNALDTFVEQSH